MSVVVRRYIDILILIITFPSPLVLALFFGSIIPISLFILKIFFSFLFLLFLCNVIIKNFKDYRHKS